LKRSVFEFLSLSFAVAFIAGILQPAYGDSVCAKSYVQLRKGPGSKNPATWSVAKYMPFVRLETKSGWSKVQDLEGDVHWVRSSEVSNQIRCVVVRTNVASLRTAPSATAVLAEFKSVDRYTPLKRLESRQEWLQVEDEQGRQAWVHESQVWKPVQVQSFSF